MLETFKGFINPWAPPGPYLSSDVAFFSSLSLTIDILKLSEPGSLVCAAQVLGSWYEKGKVLIFVQSQEKCDTLFRDLLKVRTPLALQPHSVY